MHTHPSGAVRYEVKAICDQVSVTDVRSWIELHPEGFVQAYPPRQVNSVYLDTYELACTSDNLDGVAERTKLRFRWYGPNLTAVRGELELKHRLNRLGWKEYGPVSTVFDLTTISWHTWMCELRACTTGRIAEWLGQFDHPTLMGCYVREYYESQDEQVRVTVDYDLVFYEQITYSQPNLSFGTLANDLVVVELKAPLSAHKRISQVLSAFPFRPDRNSKYVQGLASAWYD